MDAQDSSWLARCRAIATTGPILDRLRIFRTCLPLSFPLVAGNLWAVWWGWTIYYIGQFNTTSVVLWPFVSDSPNAVLAFALAVVAGWFGLRAAGLDLLAWILNIKVGLWTTFALLYWYDYFFSFDTALRWMLFWLHLGMIMQVFVLHHALRTRPPSRLAWALVVVYVVVDVAVDYWPGVGNHPRMPDGPYTFASVLGAVTTVLTLAVVAAAAWLYGRRAAGSGSIGRDGR